MAKQNMMLHVEISVMEILFLQTATHTGKYKQAVCLR